MLENRILRILIVNMIAAITCRFFGCVIAECLGNDSTIYEKWLGPLCKIYASINFFQFCSTFFMFNQLNCYNFRIADWLKKGWHNTFPIFRRAFAVFRNIAFSFTGCNVPVPRASFCDKRWSNIHSSICIPPSKPI